MRITFLIPGTGSFLCGSCLRDVTLVRALKARGHDVTVVPLYLPMTLEEPERLAEIAGPRVFMGGINMYLQQKSALFARLPGWAARLLDAPGLLRWSAARGDMTEAADLAEMTLSMLRGEDGRQAAELEKLMRWMAAAERPDVVILSNVMLSGLARRLRRSIGCRLLCSLQGEVPFLDALPQPHRDEAWAVLAERIGDVDGWIAVSADYGRRVCERLPIEPDKLHVVHNGIELDGFDGEPDRSGPPTIGYLARMCPDKGLHTLVEAFRILKDRGAVPGLRLRAAGVMLRGDRKYVREQRDRLRAAGVADDAELLPNVDLETKMRVLRSMTVLSVPATYGESFGLYVIEALAAGVPVVQPRHGAFPELIEATGGGVLCEPDDARSLADALEGLLLDPPRAAALAEAGRAAVRERFTAERMASEVEKVCMMAAPAAPPDREAETAAPSP